MRRDLSPRLAKGAAGFLAGLALWWALSVPYGRLLAFLSGSSIHLMESPPVTSIIADGTELTIDRTDFPPSSPRPALLLMDLTANFIVLMALFGANREPLSDRNVSGLLLASLVLVVVHVAAVVVNVQMIYALRLGPWSDRHYGPVARNFWGAGAHFYSLVGAFGASFALWWLFRPSPVSAAKERRVKPRREPSRVG